MWQYILILHIWCIYYASRWHQWWWQHKSRNQSRVSSFGRLPTILLLQIPKNCPRKKIPLRDRRWKKKCFNKQFDLKILSLSKIFVKSGFFCDKRFWSWFRMVILSNKVFFGDTVFDLLEVELVLWFHYLYSLWELGHGWKRWGGQTGGSLSQLTSGDVEDKDTLLFLLI